MPAGQMAERRTRKFGTWKVEAAGRSTKSRLKMQKINVHNIDVQNVEKLQKIEVLKVDIGKLTFPIPDT